MLSKPLRPQLHRQSISKPDIINYKLSYSHYNKNNVDLKKYKLPELKTIVKEYNLTRTGNKGALIRRIEEHFLKIKTCVRIQTVFRGWLVKQSFRLRGEAYKNRSICVNDTDFITLEPLREIPYELFYSYKDKKNFTYGFNITSLMQFVKNKTPLKNPYNREKFSDNHVHDIISLNNITKIIYNNLDDEINYFYSANFLRKTNITRTPPVLENVNTNQNFSREYYIPTIIPGQYNVSDMNLKYNFILETRSKSIDVRIQNLFMEIDQLGNYTQSSWFSNLDRIGCLRFYRNLSDLWQFRAQLSYDIKKKICPFLEPFANIFNRNVIYNDAPLEDFQTLCVTVMENLIYCGFDDEFRKISAFHLLSALTLVSVPARIALPWLYESISY